MQNVVIDNRSEPLMQALLNGDSQNAAWTSFDMTPVKPSGDGVWSAGDSGGIHAPQRLFLLPYCEGLAGSNFSVRIYGWNGVENPDGGPNRNVWIPYLLAELACVACNRFGPPLAGPIPQVYAGRFIQPDEAACDTITLTQGGLGLTGEIVSTGPGTDLIAFAIVELRGCKLFQFDFQQTDPVPMNCLWRRA